MIQIKRLYLIPLAQLFFICAFIFSPQAHATPMFPITQTGQSDQNQYAYSQLENGLTVVMVNDPMAERPAASMAIKVGSYQDPNEHLGLAHLLEHMLFLGTEKYPEAGSYQAFIKANGGSHNAYTSSQITNYYFEVLPSAFNETLDRFSQFFVSPTLDPNYIEREIHAVDSEYRAKINDESRRSNEASKTLFNPLHPASRFTVGNLDTLGNIDANTLRTKLLGLYNQYYTADNMVLTVVANMPLAELEPLVSHYFSNIPKRKASKPAPLPELRTSSSNIQFFKTNTEKNVVKFSFLIPSQLQSHRTQPVRYISYILGDESPNSLFADLKNKHWAQALHVGTDQDDGEQAQLSITINLTDEGVIERNQVVQKLFSTIDNLRSNPINERYLKETLTLSTLNFDYHEYIPALRLAQVLSSRALDIPTPELLNSFRILENASTESIRSIIANLTKEKLTIQWLNDRTFPFDWIKSTEEWKTEPLYQGEYLNATLNETFGQVTNNTNSSYGLPLANPYMPDDLSVDLHHTYEPHLVAHHLGFNAWHKTNTKYQKPTGMIFGYFGFLEDPTEQDRLILQLWAKLYNDSLSESTYQPYMAGLNYQLYAHSNGLTLRTSGYNDKQCDYFNKLTEALISFRAKEERLAIAKQEILKGLNNLDNQAPHNLARHYFNQVVIKGNSSNEELKALLNTLTLADINRFIEKHIHHFQFTSYVTGNFSLEDSKILAHKLSNQFNKRLYKHPYRYVELKTFKAREHYLYTFDTRSTDSTVLYSLIATEHNQASTTELAYMRILTQLLGAKFYNEFRTEKQYGYIVAVTNQTIEKTPSIGFLVQSPNTDNETLVKEIERFISELKWNDEEITDLQFEQARNAVLAAYKKPPTSLAEEAIEEWPHIVEPEHNFLDRQQWIEALNTLKKEEFLEFMRAKVEKKQSARVLISNRWTSNPGWLPLEIE